MRSVSDIRRSFLSFFENNGHEIVTSSSLVPHNDPTLMFTNAGMVQFKDVFTNHETRSYNKAASSQKCVRAGGKHNDLDNVGYTARHHTFFEMLGNFSFGDYFKEGAIKFAWDFLTKELKLPPEKILITVYHTDVEAFNLWKKISGFSDDKIIKISTNDNFWMMGNTGPCGPCSEIFYDHGPEVAGGPPGSPDADGDRFIEIWNLVFMQYETLADGSRINLPAPSIDTGMGLERVSAVLQGVHDNYDIDLFKSIISASKEISKNSSHHNSHRVIADHLRSSSFLLADGVTPSNEGRGYVLRRIMRRAMRHVHIIGYQKPLMHKLVPVLIKEMGEAYPELGRAQNFIIETLKLEEENFRITLERGLKLLEEHVPNINNNVLNGDVAFKLYDTYGFPLDLTSDILRSRGISVDTEGFLALMSEQKKRARAAWKGSGETATDDLWFKIKEEHGSTEFLGYACESSQGTILSIVKDGKEVETAESGQEISLILDQTSFYGESGGQEGDKGILKSTHAEIAISDTKKVLDGLHIHIGKVISGSIKKGKIITATIDGERRRKIKSNHSATHILHAVLRKIIGTHITQKGSLVAEDRLRFDISSPKPITNEELLLIESEVNRIIRDNAPTNTKIMPPEEAVKSGAMALFGEKYGDEVRVISMDYSTELCGGTHVARVGDIGLFKIISESAVAAGIRRIEAITGDAAIAYVQNMEQNLRNISSTLKTSPETIGERINALIDERKNLEKELSNFRRQSILSGDINLEEISGIKFIGKNCGDIPSDDLRNIAGDLLKKLVSGVVVVASSIDNKGSIIITVSDDLSSKISAIDLVKIAAPILGAKGGGGKPNFAQTGGPEGGKIEEAVEAIRGSIRGK